MSKQTLNDVISTIIAPMLNKKSIDERIHEYVVQLVKANIVLVPLPDKLPLPCSDPFLEEILLSRLSKIDNYMEDLKVWTTSIPETFEQTVEEELVSSIDTVRTFVYSHVYSSTETLRACGFSNTLFTWFMKKPVKNEIAYVRHVIICAFGCKFRNQWRMPPLRMTVWTELVSITTSMIHRIRSNRVCELTEHEKEEVIREALKKKRKLVHPEYE